MPQLLRLPPICCSCIDSGDARAHLTLEFIVRFAEDRVRRIAKRLRADLVRAA